MYKSLSILLFFTLFLFSSCHPHKQAFLQTADSLIAVNQNLVKTLESSLNKETLDKIKLESGSRLILLDKYQEAINVADTAKAIFKYARLHNDVIKLDNKNDELRNLLKTQILSLKKLCSDIETSAWPDDSLQTFLAKEKHNLMLLGENVLLIREKEKGIEGSFEVLHPVVATYTDSLLKAKL